MKRRPPVLLVVFVLASCGDDPRTFRPLRDDRHVPDVLVEQSTLSPRPTLDGNRFLAGWWPRKQQDDLILTALPGGGRLELVHLTQRPRTLALDLVDDGLAAGGRVEVRAAGRDLGAFALTSPLRIPLPADLPLGRVLVELTPRDAPLRVRGALVRSALPAGETRWEGEDLVHTGDSRIDFVRRVRAGQVLTGAFTSPSGPRPGQKFTIRLEREDGTVTRPFEWSATAFRGRRRFEISLGESGLVRLSLEAQGGGPSGRWSALALTTPEETPVPEPATVEPPTLVVLYVMDALRADSPHSPDGVSPTWDRLAGEGFTFKAHRSVAPNTLPATKALLTGKAWVDRGGRKLPVDEASTLAEAWRAAGYRTGLFSGNTYVSPAYGVERGFEQVTEVPLAEARAPYNDNAERLHEAALAWLRSLPSGTPAFVYVHAIHPHNPYDPPEPWRSEATRGLASTIDGSTKTLLDLGQRRLTADEADRERLKRLYAASLSYADAELGRFLAELESLHPREQLFVAVTSDHGEELFDHGGVLHGYTLYEEMIRIPLVLWSPGRLAAGSHEGPTSTLDLHATLLGLAGGAGGEGRSLMPLTGGADDPRREDVHLAAAASVKGGLFSAQTPRWKLIWAPRTGTNWGLGGGHGRTRSPEYLFDLENDPGELVNRAGEGGLEAAWLRSRLRAWIAAKKAKDGEGVDVPVDEETRRRLEALGYVQ